MHSMILGAAGYSLLLSSLATLIVLIRKGLRQYKITSMYVLSTSDVLSSMFTAILLLLNQLKVLNGIPYSSEVNDTNDNRTLLLRMTNEKAYQETLQQFHKIYNSNQSDGSNFNSSASATCTFNHVIMHYAMFLVPFANAFLSLLSFFVHSNWDITCTDNRCLQLMELQKKNKDNIKQDRRLSRDSVTRENIRSTVLNVFNETKITKLKNDKGGFTSLSVISQWIVPVLLTAILHFSKIQDMSNVQDAKDTECVFTANFPFENCYAITGLIEVASLSLEEHTTPVDNDYIGSDETLRLSNPDNKDTDAVVSSVYKLIQSLINETEDNFTSEKSFGYFDTSELWNVTKYLDKDKVEKGLQSQRYTVVKNGTSPSDKSILSGNKIVTKTSEDDTTLATITDSDEEKEKVEVELFEDAMREANAKINAETSTQIVAIQEFQENITVKKENVDTVNNGSLPTTESKLVIDLHKSKDEIYADIVKRIQGVTSEYKIKDKIRNSLSNNKRQNIQNKVNVYILDDRPIAENNVFSFQNGSLLRKSKLNNIFYDSHGATRNLDMPACMENQCFLETRFVKIYLLGLVFFIYFVPILISSILYIRAKYKCQSIIEKLELNNIMNKITNDSTIIAHSEPLTTDAFRSQEVKSGWFADSSEQCNKNMGECSQAWAEVGTSKDNRQTLSSVSEQTRSMESDESDKYISITRETKKIQMISQVLRRSLIFGVLLWTPLFLEVLSKVFLCARSPDWLINIVFLIGLSFGIVRNFLNLNMLNMQGVYEGNIEKENSVHPFS